MKCPVCGVPAIVLEIDQIEIDHCIKCGGVWLDGGELELLLEGAEQREKLLGSFQIDVETKEKKIRCPICSKKMEKVLCGFDNKIRIDKCSDHDGIWFDKGELYEVISLGGFPSGDRVFSLLNDIFGGKY
jgi:Zn-finger nucleic acid-binding protein